MSNRIINDIPFSFDDQFRMSELKRWHVINTVREQTLADHSFQVAMLVGQMMIWDYERMWSDSNILNTIVAAMYHDAHEVHMGDTPTCAKQHIAVDAVEYYVPPYWRAYLRITESHRDRAKYLIKLADSVEALVWLSQNSTGSHAEDVVRELRARVYGMLGADQVSSHLRNYLKQYLQVEP